MPNVLRRPFSAALVACALLAGCAPAPVSRSAQPAASPSGEARLFEMRTYTTPPGKLPDLQRRFQNHTMRLFERHGMTNIGYWVPQDTALAQNTLIYILAYPSRAARDASWRAFQADPEWVSARAASEANGPILLRVQSTFMDPTTWSPIR